MNKPASGKDMRGPDGNALRLLTKGSTQTGKICRFFRPVIPSVMRIIPMRRSNKVYFSGLLVVCIVMIIGYFALWQDRNIKVYDENFKILDYSISKGGGAHIFYQGNQTLGRMRLKLQLQYGLKFWGGRSLFVVADGPESLVFLMRYKGDFAFEELDSLRAVLTNDKNISKELRSFHMREQARQTFIACYTLPKLPASDDSFRIDFRLKSADDPIASWRVGKLNKHNKGLNADL